MQTCITYVRHQRDDFPLSNKEFIAVTGSLLRRPKFRLSFQNTFGSNEQTNEPKEKRRWRRHVKQNKKKKLLYVAMK
jgi:hypothetical protein